MPKFVCLVGEPASGKTTIFKNLISKFNLDKNFSYGLLRGHIAYNSGIAVLGIYDQGTFQGTDRLSMAVMPDAIRFLESKFCKELKTVFFEGDRLGSLKFLEAVSKVYSLVVYQTVVAEHVIEARHKFRGDTQTETWLKGRKSKVKKVSQVYNAKPLFNQNEQDLISAINSLFLESLS